MTNTDCTRETLGKIRRLGFHLGGYSRFGSTIRAGVACASVALLVAACSNSASVAGPKFPSRSITLIVPTQAGSTPDIIARKVAPLAARYLDGSIVVEDQPGGAGIAGLHAVASSSPNGYTIGLGVTAQFAVDPYLVKTALDPEQVTPIAELTSSPDVLFVKESSPVTSIRSFVAYARAHHGLTLAVDKAHSLLGLDGSLLSKITGTGLNVVPVGAGHQALEVLNGSAIAGILSPAVLKPYIASHELRIIGVFAAHQIPGLSVPTFMSAGLRVAAVPDQFIFGPKSMPTSVVQRLANAFSSAVKSSTYQQWAHQNNLSAEYSGPTLLRETLASNYKNYGSVLKTLGWIKS